RVYLTDDVVEILKRANKVRSLTHTFVFTNKNGRPVKTIRTAFEGACRRAGIKEFVMHDLRHCFATNMRKAGIHDSVIMAQTGHKTTSMFLRYNTVDESDGRDAVSRLTDYLCGDIKKVTQK
ncbi:MAG: site-specific integrase, partial [Deltaproteobacteria bacterium]|nr:site-specific integrase [Candidatus Zymogenaceae bacterium]